MEYDSAAEAREAALAGRRFGRRLEPYACDTCGCWHLAPAGGPAPVAPGCSCTGRDGQYKDTYRTREDAQRRADLVFAESRVRLRVYRCRSGTGWHLTAS